MFREGFYPIEAPTGLAEPCETVHTPLMTLKNAAFLALVGMVLLTILMAADFIITFSGVLRGIVPAMTLLMSLIHLFASFAVTVFFWVFHRAQG
jgi:hypothetical protein